MFQSLGAEVSWSKNFVLCCKFGERPRSTWAKRSWEDDHSWNFDRGNQAGESYSFALPSFSSRSQ